MTEVLYRELDTDKQSASNSAISIIGAAILRQGDRGIG